MDPQILFQRLKGGGGLQSPVKQTEDMLKIYQQLQKVVSDANDQKFKMDELERKIKDVEKYNTELEQRLHQTTKGDLKASTKIPRLSEQQEFVPFNNAPEIKQRVDYSNAFTLDNFGRSDRVLQIDDPYGAKRSDYPKQQNDIQNETFEAQAPVSVQPKQQKPQQMEKASSLRIQQPPPPKQQSPVLSENNRSRVSVFQQQQEIQRQLNEKSLTSSQLQSRPKKVEVFSAQISLAPQGSQKPAQFMKSANGNYRTKVVL